MCVGLRGQASLCLEPHECVLLHVCWLALLRASVGLCLILRASLVLIYSLFCSLSSICETMISPLSRSFVYPFFYLQIFSALCTVYLVIAKPTPHTKMWFTCAGTYFTMLAYHVILHKTSMFVCAQLGCCRDFISTVLP